VLARPLGALAFAGEHTAGAFHGLMEGALRSGVRAAEDVLSR
jgi:monoamine oxidase